MATTGRPLGGDTISVLSQVDECTDVEALPLVSIIIPMRNEERHIFACLESVLANDYPEDRLEIFCVDGKSEDDTRAIVQRYAADHQCVKLLENPKQVFPAAVNIGIREANGELIAIMGAHSSYTEGYISRCVNFLEEFDADNVGGVLKTMPRDETGSARAIAFVLSHPFGAGNSHFRLGSAAPMWVDTVFGGCYKREVFEKIGLFNENLRKSSDTDLNLRLQRAGGRILLVPEIVASYYAPATMVAFWKNNFNDGFSVTYPLKFGRWIPAWRHLIPLLFVCGLIAGGALSLFSQIFLWVLLVSLVSYVLITGLATVQIAYRERAPILAVMLPLTFAVRHIAYGLGSLVGLANVLASPRFWAGLFRPKARNPGANGMGDFSDTSK